MTREIEEEVAVAFGAPILNIAWIVRLDIEGDPVYAWTGLGPLIIGPSQFNDAQLNGRTYEGLANIGEIGKVVDTLQGSQSVRLTLPGIKLDDEALQQIVYDQRRWQDLPGYLWVVPLGDNGALVGEPVRAKSGKMDNLIVERRQGEGVVRIDIEGFTSYSQRALLTRYSEQNEIDPNDHSQDYVHDLANKVAGIGDKTSVASGRSTGNGSTGNGGGRDSYTDSFQF